VSSKVCTIEGCDKPMSARGWCAAHYTRWRKHGDPLTVLPRGATSVQPCGTYAAYQRHNLHNEQVCDECRAANAEYKARWREKPGIRDKERERRYARARAMARLAKEFPVRYRALYEQEMQDGGAP